MASLFHKPKTPKPPPLPAPPPLPEAEEPQDVLKRMRKRRGRADTILAGDLVPMDIGQKTLLG